jgi:hypothetical protein
MLHRAGKASIRRRPVNSAFGGTKATPTSTAMSDRIEAWNDGSAICVIAVGSHGDPLDLATHEVRNFIGKLEACLSEDPATEATDKTHRLRRSWGTTLRYLAASRFYLPARLESPSALKAEQAFNDYLHNNELGLALYEVEAIGTELNAPSAFWQELRLAATEMGLHANAERYAARSAA